MKSLNKSRKKAIREAMHGKNVEDFEAILSLCGYSVVNKKVLRTLMQTLLGRKKCSSP